MCFYDRHRCARRPPSTEVDCWKNFCEEFLLQQSQLQYLSDICPNIFQYLFKYCLIVVSEFNCGCFWPKQRKNYPQTLIVVVGIVQQQKYLANFYCCLFVVHNNKNKSHPRQNITVPKYMNGQDGRVCCKVSQILLIWL